MKNRTPFSHQVEGAQYISGNHGGWLFMEQRTGKTLTALLAMRSFIGLSKVLIVTKASIMETWKQELALEQCNGVSVVTGTKEQREKKLGDPYYFYVVNYEMLVPYRVIDRYEWDVVIFDESSSVANEESKVTRYALRAMNRQRKNGEPLVMCLSGNPAPEHPIQYASQFLLVKGDFYGCKSVPDYVYQYWKDVKVGPRIIKEAKNPLHLVSLRARIKNDCFIRTMKELQLGSKILYGRRTVEMNEEQRAAFGWAIAKKNALGEEIGDKVYVGYVNQIGAGINPRTGEMSNLAKIHDMLDYFQENPEPILALSFFKAPLWAGMVEASTRGLRADIITGDTPVKERETIRERFQMGELDILFGQSDAVKMGIDLSQGSLTWFLSNSFSNDTRDQVVMRTTNVNKKEPVQVIDSCTLGTLDSVIVDKLVKKELISDAFLVGEFHKLIGGFHAQKK